MTTSGHYNLDNQGVETNLGEQLERVPTDGRWGEHEQEPVVIQNALDDFEELRRELSHVSTAPSHHIHLHNALTKTSSRFSATGTAGRDQDLGDLEKQPQPEEEPFNLEAWIRQDTERERASGIHPKRVGVSFKHLSVSGLGNGAVPVATFTATILHILLGGVILDYLRLLFPFLRPKVKPRTILHDFSGLVRAGEMLLVLGPPGAGTTTFLRALTNQRAGYAEVGGAVLYDGIEPDVAAKHFRGEIVFNDEDDLHYSTLTVAQTLRFALSLKTPNILPAGETSEQFVDKLRNLYGKMFGIEHTMNTFVGGDHKARGVSGGERKRVSIAEVLAARAAIVAFDNSTRGLDSSTAVDYIRSLRVLTDVTHSTTIVTLYQAGEGLYREFDKVCLIDQGRQIFYGPASEARRYFENLGFVPAQNITTADFLTSLSRPSLRRIKPGFEQTAPKTPEEFEAIYKASHFYDDALREIDEYHADLENTGHQARHEFASAVQAQRYSNKSLYTVSFFKQVYMIIIREFQLQWQDQVLLRTKIVNSVVVGLLIGAMFYNLSPNSPNVYDRSGVLFFSLTFNGWLLQVEVGNIINDRVIHNKHRRLGMFRPSALIFGKTISDLPMIATQVTIYVLLTYFLSNLSREAGKFFLFLFIVFLGTVTMMAMYRCIAVFSGNSDSCLRLVSALLNALLFWTGYVQPSFQMPWWYRWIYYINPITYPFEALSATEFHGRHIICEGDQLVPNIAGADINHQACSLPGAVAGQDYVLGDDFIKSHFGYSHGHLYRNIGIEFGYLVGFICISMLISEFLTFDAGSGQVKQYVKMPSVRTEKVTDESLSNEKQNYESDGSDHYDADHRVATGDEEAKGYLFTFENVSLVVPTPDGDKQLLENVEGYAVPGKLLALMGTSGAGKTTLLNTISQRMRIGYVSGIFRANGHDLPKSFQRRTGFVEQQDLHEPKQTVREALRFSARLRQSRHISLREKYEYVEEIINLLDLDSIADAIIDDVGRGLSVEERKRVTIGVELAAKPDLLFLDEPTSGLDSEGSMEIVSFLRRLAVRSNLAIICTIHQPSAILFSQFDNLLLLYRGGKTVYFGPIGRNGDTVIEYFSRYAEPPEPGDNTAEYILEAVGAGVGRRSKVDWIQVWLDSAECKQRHEETEIYNNRWLTIAGNEITQGDSEDEGREFSSTLSEQLIAVTVRLWKTLYRTPSLSYSFAFAAISSGLCAGILFFQLDNTILGVQSRAFLTYYPMLLIINMTNALEIHLIFAIDLYDLRERNSKTFSWIAMVFSYLVVPIPYELLMSVLFFPTFWYMPGLYHRAAIAGCGYFLTLILILWHGTSAVMLGSFIPSTDVVGVINPLFFVVTQCVSGLMIAYNSLNKFYKYFLFWANPLSYMIRPLVSTAVHGVPVSCAESELAIFPPPSGMTCQDYVGDWVSSDTQGVLLNPSATDNCRFCEYTVGDQYLAKIGWSYSTKWRDIGLSLMFLAVSYFVPFAVYYVARASGAGTMLKKALAKLVKRKSD
ncbi:ABC-2 type transporter-domain-containing protein [Lipomyces oligophaga]|uniref:ABC-2 type transporter-domain-containing protein n=1 Tax=Lipomyces oligophaga TaxID=45792 RepID=UPI0034CD883C